MAKIIRNIEAVAESGKLRSYAVVHVHNRERAEIYAAEAHRDARPAAGFIMDVGPVIGVHAGIGAAAVAVLDE